MTQAADPPQHRLAVPDEIDLDDPSLYQNRELSWLDFNERVLAEARDARNPLLERVKFVAITSSNLDEFYAKRIGWLRRLTVTRQSSFSSRANGRPRGSLWSSQGSVAASASRSR